MTTDRVQRPVLDNKLDNEIGGDLRYAVTANLTADLTFNTDFAQVEIDEQQVNLTRFSLFFPEKRDFFLEGRGIFEFGRGGSGINFGANQGDTPSLFYTRRIGLNAGRVIPIDAGGRLTGKVGKHAIGLVHIRTGDEPTSRTEPTGFTVLRYKRDVLSRSAIGVMATNRSIGASGRGSNLAYGVDGSFLLTQALTATAWWARTNTTGTTGDDQSYQGVVDYSVDRYGARAEFLKVGENFDPQVGFRRRWDFNRAWGQLRFSPRPADMTKVRKYTFTTSGEYVESGAGALETRIVDGHFDVELANSDKVSIDVTHDYEGLRNPFRPSGSPVAIPVGGYTFSDVAVAYAFGAQRRASGTVTMKVGEFYDGTIRSLSVGPGGFGGGGRISVLTRLAVEPTFAVTRIERPAGSFTTRISRARIDYAFTPLMFTSALLQYSSADRSFGTNIRFRWEYAPGSEIFLVYTDERDTTDERFVTPTTVRGLKNRSFVVKVNRLFRY